VEDLLVTGQNSERHVGRDWEDSKSASRSIRIQLKIEAAAWAKGFLGRTYTTRSSHRWQATRRCRTRLKRAGERDRRRQSHMRPGIKSHKARRSACFHVQGTASRHLAKLLQADPIPAAAKRVAREGQRLIERNTSG
jgi:hypothetical protein